MRAMTCITLLLVAATAGCDWMPGRPTRAEQPVDPATVTDFQTLWNTHCAGCHGTDGRMGAARPLNDPLYLALADDHQLTHSITLGVPGTMAPAMAAAQGGPLDDAQVQAIIDGMRTHWGTAAAPPNAPALRSTQAGDVTRGRNVFMAYCAGCHGDDGTGDKAGSIVDGSFLAMVSDDALRSAVICGRIDVGMPAFDDHGRLAPLTDTQIADVVAWVASHRVKHPGAPGPSLIEEGRR